MPRFQRAFVSILATLFALVPIGPQLAHADSIQPAVMIQVPGVPLDNACHNPCNSVQWNTDFIRLDAANHLLYLTDGANNALDVFDTTTQTMVERIGLISGPHDAIVDDNLNLIMVPMSDQKVAIIDLTTGMETDIDVGGTSIADLAGYNPATKLFVVGSKGTNQLSFIQVDPAGSKMVGQLALGSDSPEEPVYYKGNYILAGPRNAVLVIDPNTMTSTARWDVPNCSGHGFAKGPGAEAYLGCSRGGVILNLDTGAVVATFTPDQVGDTDQPAYDASTNRYYAPGHVTRKGADVAVLGVIDASSHKLISTLDTDPGSQTQAATDGNGTVYIATAPAVGGACLSNCLFGYQP